MIYTSYYGNIKNIPKDYTLISISGAISDDIRNLVNFQDKSLAPSKDIYFNYKSSNDWQEYTKQFLVKTKNVNIHEKFNMFLNDDLNAVILCYETPFEFCHRHIVAELIEKTLLTTVKELNHENLSRHNYKMINNIKDWE